jgi:hypothetical protein
MGERENRNHAERGLKKNMKKSKIIVIILIVLFLIVSAFMIFYNTFYAPEVLTLKMSFETADKMGFNTGIDQLYFGKSYPGSLVTTSINLTNKYDYPVQVSIKLYGDISPFVSVSSNDFLLLPSEKKAVTYYLQTEEDTGYRNFTGETRIFIKRSAQ